MFSGIEVVDVRHGRRWTALASFVLQGIVVSAAVILPLLNPSTMPFPKQHVFVPIVFGDRQVRVMQENIDQHGAGVQAPPIVVEHPFTYSRGHNSSVTNLDPPMPNVLPGGGRQGTPEGINSILSDNYQRPLLRPEPVAKPRPVSVMMEGNLIHRVEPPYPMIAKQIRLQGTVVLRAMVGADGTIEQIQVISGHPILVQEAREAVRQWRYRPYFLNGMAIPVETEVTVKFVLNQ